MTILLLLFFSPYTTSSLPMPDMKACQQVLTTVKGVAACSWRVDY